MRCDACGQDGPVVAWSVVAEAGDTTTRHLCPACAAAAGVQVELPLTGSAVPGLACPGCGATLQDLRSIRRAGCAGCWTTYEEHFRVVVGYCQRATRHRGKGPPLTPEAPAAPSAGTRWRLQEALAAAVLAERFETAALLRDQLRALDG